MEDNVVEIIPRSALDAIDEANALLAEAVRNVNDLAEAGKKVKIDISGAGSLANLSQVAAQVNTVTEQMAQANDKVTESVKKRQRAIEMAERNELLAIERAIKAEERRQQKIQEGQERTQKLGERMQRNMESYMKRLQKEQEKNQKLAEKAAAAAAKEANAYEKLKREYTATANEAKRLSAQYGVGSAEAKKFNEEAARMADQLKEIEAAVGQHQRSVGNYQNATLALSQIIREAPAFANSLQTGLMAIGNNLPILVDEFNKLKETTGDAKEAFKILTGSLFSFQNIMILAFTAVQFAVPLLKEYFGASEEGAAALKKYNEALVNVNQNMGENIAQAQVENKQLLMTAANVNASMKVRLDAIDKLRKANEGLLDDLSNEEILANKTAEAEERLNKAIYARFLAQSYGDKAALAMKKKFELTTERYDERGNELPSPIAAAALRVSKAEQEVRDYIADLNKQNPFTRAIQSQSNDFAALQKKVANARAEYASLNKELERAEQQVQKFNKRQQEANEELESMKVKGPYGEKEKKEKIKKEKDYEFQANNERIKAIYEARRQEMEAAKDFNKEIADDEKASLEARLDAYQKYVAAILMLAQLDRDEQIALEDEKIAALERKSKKAKGDELKAIQESIEAAKQRKINAENAFQVTSESVQRNAVRDTLAITISANNEWVKTEEEANEKVMQGRMALYMAEENLLNDALKKKEISRKEHNKRLAEVQKQANLMALEAAIAFDEKILANQQLSDEKRLQYEKKLTADKKAYMNAQKGSSGGSRNNSRITDPIAMMFAPDENQEQYLQDFYQRTVDLARAASDAIIQAKNRQYEEERKRLDEQASAIQRNYELQAAAINATERDEVERANKLNQLMVTTQTKQAEIENQKKKAAQEQAKFQRAASMAAIIQNTAVAIASALKYGPAAPPIIALIAAAGAIQLASAANAPIPAYAEGTLSHKGGLFWAGDGGEREMIVPGNGKSPYWSKPSTTLYNESAGTMVLPESWLKFATSNLSGVTPFNTPMFAGIDENKIIDGLAEKFERSLIRHGNYLGSQIVGSKTNLSEITEALRRQQKLQG